MNPEHFLEQFFGDANRFSYDSVREGKGGTYESIQRWASSLVDSSEPVVLPRWRNNQVVWYGIAQTDRQAQRLIEEVKAFVGPSYSTFTGERARLDREDPVEQAVEAFTGGKAIKFTGDDQGIRRTLDRMHNVRKRRTRYQQEEEFGVGVVLRRFEMALRAGNRADAEGYLGYLRERDLLDRRNLRHLLVRMLAALSEWEELLGREEVPDLLRQEERPLRVTRALIQAVYHTHLAPLEDENDLEEVVKHFQSDVLPEYGALFTARSSMKAPEVLKAFMMKAVSGEETDDRLRSDLLETADEIGFDDPLFEALAEWGGESRSKMAVADPVDEAMTAVLEGRPDEAFRLLQHADASPQKARGLASLYNSLQNLDVEHALEKTLGEIQESDRENLVEQFEVCRRIIEAGPASGWTDWFERVQEEAYDSPEQALQDAEKIAEEWHPQQVLDTPDGLLQFVQAVRDASLDGQTGRTVSRALPKLLEALQEDPEYPRSTFQSLYGAVQDRIPYTNDLTQSDLTVYQDLTGVRLQHGVSKSVYEEIIEQAEYLWQEAGAPSRIDWLLDFAELLVLVPSQDEEARLRFLTTVVQALQKHRDRVEPIQIKLFRSLCEEVGQPDLSSQLPTEEAEKELEDKDPLRDLLDGRTLGIYTLTESAGRRAASFLEDHCQDLTVHLRHDKAGNAELESVAQSADYFLVVTWSAKHAATDVIEQNVPTERLIRPRGKGESSMLRDLSEYAKQKQTNTKKA